MKNLKDIIEGQNFLVNKKLQNRQIQYEYFPKTKGELVDIIVERLINGETDLNCIDISKLKDLSSLFWLVNRVISVDNIDISKWDVSNVVNMGSMFEYCKEFNSDLSNWDVSNVTNMLAMFECCSNFNSDLSNWNVSNVTNMEYMFDSCTNFNSDLSKWNVRPYIKSKYMFDKCTTLKKNNLIPDWYSN